MTPSNPNTNNTPLIYRIADAAGVFHLVAPVDHTHTYQDVPGLTDELSELWAGLNEKANQEDMTEALAGKANAIGAGSPSGAIVIVGTSGEISRSNKTITDLLNAIAAKQDALTFDSTPTAGSTNPVTSGGVKAALDAKRQIRQDDSETSDHAIVSATAEDGDVYIRFSVREGDNIKSASITLDNIENLIRALIDPDSTPTANSDNLVTSGGVAVALAGKQDTLTFDSTPTENSNNPVTSGGVKAALDGKAPEGDTEVIFEEGENLFLYLPNYFSNGERQRSFILNYQGEQKELIELFGCSTHDMIRI